MSKHLYFSNMDGTESCRTIEGWKDYMRYEGIKCGTLFKAKLDRGGGYGYCIKFGEFTERGETCGKSVCKLYAPRNGRSGICKHQRPCYECNTVNGRLITIK